MSTTVSGPIAVNSGVTSTGLNVTGTDDIWVNSGGTFADSTAGTIGTLFVLSSGYVSNVLVTSANFSEEVGGTLSSVTVGGFGNGQINGAAYTLIESAVSGGGALAINSGATVSGLYAQAGSVNVSGGATVSNLVVSHVLGGSKVFPMAQVLSGAVVKDVSVTGWGQATVSSGASVSNVTLTNLNGTVPGFIAASGATISGATVNSGTVLSANSGVTFSGLIADSGMVSGGTLASGAELQAVSGSASDIVIGSGASAFVAEGDLNNTTVLAGATLMGGVAGGYSGNTVVSSGGTVIMGEVRGPMVLSNGASASELWMVSGGTLSANSVVLSGITHAQAGTIINGVVNSGSTVQVTGTGVTSGLTVNSGGQETVSDQGVAAGTTLNSGATISANGGTIAGSTMIQAGATVTGTSATQIYGTMTDAGTLINGTVATSSNGAWADAGHLNVVSSGVVSGVVTVTTAAVLNVYDKGNVASAIVSNGNYNANNSAHVSSLALDGTLALGNLSDNSVADNVTVNDAARACRQLS
ncbi:hypothetical protein, partial [Acetobacter tropicalis]|uniref:beta strand repeat-containing protein n=1 Tax=Acetobacter tropicalis TaxID=104102 RepID=UPI0011D1E56B